MSCSGKSTIKVAVIGAGAAGLCSGRHLMLDSGSFSFDIFEQQDDVGGLWRYTDIVGKDEYGQPLHSSAYKNLMTNSPKELVAFPDFPIPYCKEGSHLYHTFVQQYLKDYAQHFNLYKFIKFCKRVENVKPMKQPNNCVEWAVTYSDVKTKERKTAIYDAVMVCNGRYSVPYIPDIPGLEDFQGLVMHSHDYREAEPFRNSKVVVLGAGDSGTDIAIELSNVAKEVVLSHNRKTIRSLLLANMHQEKGLEKVEKSSVTFIGGKTYHCDVILLCTGYRYHYPFLDRSCNINICDQRISHLYLHTFLIEYPTLAILGILKIVQAFPIFNQQVKVFLKFLKGQILLPSKEAMRTAEERDFARKLEEGFEPRHVHCMPGQWQWDFDDALSELGQIPPLPEWFRDLFKQNFLRKTEDVLNYKENNYRSVPERNFVQGN